MNGEDRRRPPEDERSLRRLGVAALALVLAWLTYLSYVVHAAMPFNPIRLPLEKKLHARLYAPQGWSFFTRNPREDAILYFVEEEGRWLPASGSPLAQASNLFGLDRAVRARLIEAGLLHIHLRADSWRGCSGSLGSCLGSTPPAASVDNISPRPVFCGHVGFVRQERLPWAWSSSEGEISMPFEVARLEVRC